MVEPAAALVTEAEAEEMADDKADEADEATEETTDEPAPTWDPVLVAATVLPAEVPAMG